jgi:hypothetical protein
MAFSKLTYLREIRPYLQDLTRTQRAVFDAIFDCANADGKNAHPGREGLAHAASVSTKQVGRVLQQLRDIGLIHRTEPGNRRLGHADVYELRVPDQGTSRMSPNPSRDIQNQGTSEPRSRDIGDSIKGHFEADQGTSMDVPPIGPNTTDPGPTDQGLVGPGWVDISDVHTGALRAAEGEEHQQDPLEGVPAVETDTYLAADSRPLMGGHRQCPPTDHTTEGETVYDPFGPQSDLFEPQPRIQPPSSARPQAPSQDPFWDSLGDPTKWVNLTYDSGDPNDPYSDAFVPQIA